MKRNYSLPAVMTAFALVLTLGCSQDTGNQAAQETEPNGQPAGGPPPPPPVASAPAANTPAAATPAVNAWQQGKKSDAIRLFVEADWSNRPLFPSGSAASLSEEEFRVLDHQEREKKLDALHARLRLLRELIRAVAEAGKNAAAQGNTVQARQYFSAIREFGGALNSSGYTDVLRGTGKGFVGTADSELQNLPR